MTSTTRFTDRVVLITGGGSGLGRATAVRLATEGAALSLVDVSAEGLEATKTAVLDAAPEAQVITTVADVSDEAQVEAYVAATTERFGRIDGFFNNAGIEGKQNPTESFTAAEFDKVVSINLRGVFLGLEKVLGVMREQGSGMVVNTASVGGIRGIGNQSGYAAAKHGVVGLTRNSAVEYGQYGIRVNAIAPGAIWTPMVENSATAFSGCHCGHSGYSWNGSRKYCGSIKVLVASNAVDSTRKKNHSGADRYDITPVRNTARCTGCMPLTRNRRKFIRLPWHQRRSRLSSSSRFGGSSS